MKQHFLHAGQSVRTLLDRPGPLSFSIGDAQRPPVRKPEHKSKLGQLHDATGPLVICAGCELSGEVHIGYASEMCELCDNLPPLTVASIEKLVALIPRNVKPERAPIGHRPYAERVGELLVANTAYQEEARLARRKLGVAMANLRAISKGIYDGGSTYEAAVALDAIADVERTV